MIVAEEQRRRLQRDDLERMCLPEEFWRIKIDGITAEEPGAKIVRSYLRHIDTMLTQGKGMVLMGGPGVGKTGIAALVAKEARAWGRTVFFVTTWDLREFVRSKINFDDNASIMDRCRTVDLLVLDGLRVEDAAPTEKAHQGRDYFFNSTHLEGLIRARNARKKVTIITTRLSGDELASCMLGLADACNGYLATVAICGKDKRSPLQPK